MPLKFIPGVQLFVIPYQSQCETANKQFTLENTTFTGQSIPSNTYRKPRLTRTRLPRIFTYPGQEDRFKIISIHLNVNIVIRILVTSDTFAWSLFILGKQGFLNLLPLSARIYGNLDKEFRFFVTFSAILRLIRD